MLTATVAQQRYRRELKAKDRSAPPQPKQTLAKGPLARFLRMLRGERITLRESQGAIIWGPARLGIVSHMAMTHSHYSAVGGIQYFKANSKGTCEVLPR